MKTLICKLTVFSFLFVCLCLAPSAAHAANYGAIYYPALSPEQPPVVFNDPETFLDGITPGKTYTVQVAVTNAGTMTWMAADPNAFHLSYHWTGPASLYDGERTVLPNDVAPGETVYLKATLIAPSVPGTYTLKWDMVHENVTWFSNQGVPTEDQIVGVGGKVGADQGAAGKDLYDIEYCEWTDCSGESNVENCVIPQIASGPANPLHQGSFVSVLGCGYIPQSKLFLILPASNMEVPLEIQGIFPGLIAAHVPESLVANDQIGSLVVRNPGSQSNSLPVSFKTLKEIVLLPQSKIQVVSCSPSADYNYCNDTFTMDPNICCVLDTTGFLNSQLSSFSSIASYHMTDGSIWGDSGKDVYSVKLAPGWTLEKMDFGVQITNGGGGSVDQPAGFVKGATSATITVGWSVGGNSGSAYYIDLYAIGPKGTKP